MELTGIVKFFWYARKFSDQIDSGVKANPFSCTILGFENPLNPYDMIFKYYCIKATTADSLLVEDSTKLHSIFK